MGKRRFRLTVRNHGDTCFLANAVREHGRKCADEAHSAMIRALNKGDKEEAKRCQDIRDDATRATHHYERAFDELRKKFEFMMNDEPREGSGEYNSCPGDVGARDSY